jgi:hypothetical protein
MSLKFKFKDLRTRRGKGISSSLKASRPEFLSSKKFQIQLESEGRKRPAFHSRQAGGGGVPSYF